MAVNTDSGIPPPIANQLLVLKSITSLEIQHSCLGSAQGWARQEPHSKSETTLSQVSVNTT